MAQTRMPSDRARPAAVSTFSLRPLADSSSSVSPGRPCAATCRANASAGAEVVADRGEAGRVGVQRDRGQRRAVGHVPADQLGGQVLGFGGAAAVPGHQQPVPGTEWGGQEPSPAPRGRRARFRGCRSAPINWSRCEAISAGVRHRGPLPPGPGGELLRHQAASRRADARFPGRHGVHPAASDRPCAGTRPAGSGTSLSVDALGLGRDPGPGVPAAGPAAPASPNAARSAGSREQRPRRRRERGRVAGGDQQAGVPCTTLSVRPPTALATTGTPQAIASSGVMPNGSYQGVHTTTSADRIRAGTWSRGRPR